MKAREPPLRGSLEASEDINFFVGDIYILFSWPLEGIEQTNVLSAMAFAAGHLPATAKMFGELTPLLLLRCFLLNGAAGLLFGRFYRKYGIQYAILAHMLFHLVSRTIWLIAIP